MKEEARMPISHLLPDWMRMPTLPFLVGNELRAVFPIFAGALAMIVVSLIVDPNFRESVAIVGYGLGSVASAAIAFGHDFTHRTLLATLAQPVSRHQIWKTRMIAMLAAVLPLTLVGAWPLGLYRLLGSLFLAAPIYPATVGPVMMVAAFLAGVCIAPALTLLCRSALAGTVFTICVPFLLMYGGEYVWSLIIVWPLDHQGFLWYLVISFITVSIAGLIGTPMLWARLQVLDARPVSLTLGNWQGTKTRSHAAAQRRSPWLQLAWKELRLQWLAIVPVVGMCATAAAFSKTSPRNSETEMLIYTVGFWAVFLCLILGAVGSAEERQLGLSDSQALLPVSRTTQWLIKVLLLFSLACAFTVCLPLTLLVAATGRGDLPIPEPKVWMISAICVVSVALYVSSCCRTTMKAVLVSLPLVGMMLALINLVRTNEERLLNGERQIVYENFTVNAERFSYHVIGDGSIAAFTLVAPYIFGAIMIGLLLFFGCRNHFSAERSGGRLARQLFWLVGSFVVAFVAWLSMYIRATS